MYILLVDIMAERIIPITLEDNSEECSVSKDSDNDSEQTETQSVEQIINIKQTKPNVQVKALPKPNPQRDYLKEYDIFEDRAKYTLPNSNIPEKIVLVIDRAQDENFTSFIVNNSKYTPLSMLKRSIQVFLKLKHALNKHHEFAVVVLNENNAKWILNFTSDMRKLKETVHKITECEVEDTFSLNSLFDEILNNTFLPEIFKQELPPNHLVRTVIFYGRSYTIPKIEMNGKIEDLMNNPYFTCDVLMTHEPVEISNHCNKIFNALQNLDKKGLAYFFPVCRDSRRLHNCVGKLLAHPLQRPLQKLQKV